MQPYEGISDAAAAIQLYDQALRTFHVERSEQEPETVFWDEVMQEPAGEGWFYWFCLPGCLPDSDPHGPFATEAEAAQNAVDNYAIWD